MIKKLLSLNRVLVKKGEKLYLKLYNECIIVSHSYLWLR